MAQRRRVRSGPMRAPRYKWCTQNISKNYETSVATALADLIVLCAPLGDAQIQGDVTIERMLLHVHTRRLLTSNLQAACVGVAIQEVDTTPAALQVINYLDVTLPAFTTANKNILGFWPVDVPPLIDLAGVLAVQRGVQTATYEFKGRKRLERIHQGVFLTPLADATDVIQGFFQSRILLRFTGG